MTREEFEAWMGPANVATMRQMGGRLAPCTCDYEGCQGWRVVIDVTQLAESMRHGEFEAGQVRRGRITE